MTGPPSKEKREMEPFLTKERLCVRALKGGTKKKIESGNLTHTHAHTPGLVFCYTSGLDQGFWTSQADTFVTVALLTLAFLTFVLDAGIVAASHTIHTHTHTQLLICLGRLDTNDLAYDAAKRCD